MKSQKIALLAFFAMLLLTSFTTVVRAQDEDLKAAGADKDQAQTDKDTKAELAKAERK